MSEEEEEESDQRSINLIINGILFLGCIFTTWGLVLVVITPNLEGRMSGIFAMLFCVLICWGMLFVSIRKKLNWKVGGDIGD